MKRKILTHGAGGISLRSVGRVAFRPVVRWLIQGGVCERENRLPHRQLMKERVRGRTLDPHWVYIFHDLMLPIVFHFVNLEQFSIAPCLEANFHTWTARGPSTFKLEQGPRKDIVWQGHWLFYMASACYSRRGSLLVLKSVHVHKRGGAVVHPPTGRQGEHCQPGLCLPVSQETAVSSGELQWPSVVKTKIYGVHSGKRSNRMLSIQFDSCIYCKLFKK